MSNIHIFSSFYKWFSCNFPVESNVIITEVEEGLDMNLSAGQRNWKINSGYILKYSATCFSFFPVNTTLKLKFAQAFFYVIPYSLRGLITIIIQSITRLPIKCIKLIVSFIFIHNSSHCLKHIHKNSSVFPKGDVKCLLFWYLCIFCTLHSHKWLHYLGRVVCKMTSSSFI